MIDIIILFYVFFIHIFYVSRYNIYYQFTAASTCVYVTTNGTSNKTLLRLNLPRLSIFRGAFNGVGESGKTFFVENYDYVLCLNLGSLQPLVQRQLGVHFELRLHALGRRNAVPYRQPCLPFPCGKPGLSRLRPVQAYGGKSPSFGRILRNRLLASSVRIGSRRMRL